MWYKVTELKSKGLHCVQIAHELGLHRHTVEKYVKMTLEEFQASQVHDHLREHHADFPEVSEKTVFNLVLATAIIDRLLYRCEVIKLAGTSYRLENRKTIFPSEPTVNGKQLRKAASTPIQTQE